MKPKIKHPKLDPKQKPELKAFSELVGAFIEYWGFKSVQGRIQVLLEYRVIIEAEKGANGVLRFQANPNVAEAISAVLSGRELALMKKIESAQKRLDSAEKKNSPDKILKVDHSRLKQLGQWVSLAKLFLESGIESLGQSDNPFEKPEAFEELARFKF
jgi:hypothetical protein